MQQYRLKWAGIDAGPTAIAQGFVDLPVALLGVDADDVARAGLSTRGALALVTVPDHLVGRKNVECDLNARQTRDDLSLLDE